MPGFRICFINQKGGCGKSSTCFHLGGEFAARGMNVLLVDCDPQGSLSQGFFGSNFVRSLAPIDTLAGVFADVVTTRTMGPEPVPTPFSGLSMVMANQHLAWFNTPEPETAGMSQHTLRSYLDQLAGFDVVLLDCPPNLYQCSWNAMVAADAVIVPVPPEDFGTQGLPVVEQAVSNARLLNPELKLLGHLITRSDRRLLVHQRYERKLREAFGPTVFTTVIPEASAFKVALACRKPVSMHAPGSKAARLTSELAREILDRVDALTDKRNFG
jgi:chromosome partitioning protein